MTRLGIATAAALAALAVPAAAASPPSVTTGRATAIAPTSATLNGTVNPRGSSTTYFFQYGTSTKYKAGTAPTSAGSGTHSRAVAASLSGLAGATTYHYRLVAFNSSGISRGADRTFKTPPIPTVAGIAIVPDPVLFGGAVIVAGRLTGPPNIANQRVALQVNPFPYAGFRQIGNAEVTGADGSYVFPLAFQALNAQYRVVEQTGAHTISAVVTELVAPDVVRVRVRHLRGGRISVRGTVAPGLAGARVLIQLELRGGKLRTVARARTRRRSPLRAIFSHRFRLRHSGVYRITIVPTNGAYTRGQSGPIVIRR